MADRTDHLTVEISSRTGEDIDVEALCDVLDGMDVKLESYRPGAHLLSRSALLRCKEAVDSAVTLALWPGEEEAGG